MAVVLINPFVVFEGQEETFLTLWDQTHRISRLSPGYVSVRLMKARPQQVAGQMPAFTHVNVAEWDSAQSYAMALANPALVPLAAAYAAVCTFQPALYEVIRETD